jgi:amidase
VREPRLAKAAADPAPSPARRPVRCLPKAVPGLPGLSVPTGMAGAVPMGVQLTAPLFREDLLFDAAEVIEAHCPAMTPIDPR